MADLNRIIWLSNLLLLVVLAVRFIWIGFHLRYRAFFFLVCLQVVRYAVFELLGEYSAKYFWFWLFTEPILAIAYIVAVFEVYTLALRHYKGLKTMASRLMTISIVVASIISMISIFPDLQFSGADGGSWFLLTNVIRRGVYTSLLAFLILVVALITVFPVRLSRNSIIHIILFTVSFLCNASTIFVMNLKGPNIVPLVNAITGLIAGGCYLAWCLSLKPAGEMVEATVRSGMSSDEARKLLQHIARLNDLAGSSAKRL